MIDFFGIRQQKEKIGPSINDAIKRVLNHGNFIMGPEVTKLEDQLEEYVGISNCITCSSGTDALLMSLMALNIKRGDAVITSSFSYIATAEVIELLGAKTYFCDINENTFNLEYENLNEVYELAVKNGHVPKAIIGVDIFGLPARYRAIQEFAHSKSMYVIEDMAQSFGAEIRAKRAGTFGDIAATSFFPTKPLGCYGDGGAIFTENENLATIIKSIRVHGSGENKYDNVRLGINGRLDTIQAAILLEKLSVFNNELTKRKELAEIYRDKISNNYTFQYIPEDYSSAYALFSLVAESSDARDRVMDSLKDKSIPSMIYYPKPLNKQEVFSDLEGLKQENSENISQRIFSIPFHPYLDQKDQETIINILNNI